MANSQIRRTYNSMSVRRAIYMVKSQIRILVFSAYLLLKTLKK